MQHTTDHTKTLLVRSKNHWDCMLPNFSVLLNYSLFFFFFKQLDNFGGKLVKIFPFALEDRCVVVRATSDFCPPPVISCFPNVRLTGKTSCLIKEVLPRSISYARYVEGPTNTYRHITTYMYCAYVSQYCVVKA